MDFALILRLTVGLLLVGHGAQKLFGWFGGHGLHGTARWLASIGFRPAQAWALLAGTLEFGGGLLFALRLFTPLGSLGIGASMLTAIAKIHWPKLWVTEGGLERVGPVIAGWVFALIVSTRTAIDTSTLNA